MNRTSNQILLHGNPNNDIILIYTNKKYYGGINKNSIFLEDNKIPI